MSASFRNQREYREIFMSHYAMLCNFARRYVADKATCEDLVQSVFLRLWENKEQIKITGSVTSYLFSATRNAALDYLRSETRKDELQEGKSDSQYDLPRDLEREMREHMFRQKLYQAIKQLRPKTRKIFTLHKLEGLTYDEISEHLNIPRRTVEYNVYSALAQLKELLKDDYDHMKTG